MLKSVLGLPGPTASPQTPLPRVSPAFHSCASSCATRTRLSATSCLQSQRAFSRQPAHQRNQFTCQQIGPGRARLLRCQAASGPQPPSSEQDANQLVTQLNSALAQEDYARASQLRDQLKAVQGSSDSLADWREYGCPDWLADRAEKLGFRFPTEIQRRAAAPIAGGQDVIVQSQTGSGKTLSFVMPLLARLQYPPALYPEDLKAPQAVIVAPTRELGVQIVMLIYKLLGGTTSARQPGDPANMFQYTGPKGIKVRGVLDKEEVLFAKNDNYLFGVHVVVGLPGTLAELISEPSSYALFRDLRIIAVDEADACFQDSGEAMGLVLDQAMGTGLKPPVVLLGATLPQGLAADASNRGWMIQPNTVNVGAADQVPMGTRHSYIVAEGSQKLLALSRHIRHHLRQKGEDVAPSRALVFAGSEEAAEAAAAPLRNVLWNQHRIAVLLPHGEEPIKALTSFRDHAASLLLATPAASRGLDLPEIAYIYNLDPPASAVDYVHRAGRAGRIGSFSPGTVVTVVSPDQLPALQQMAASLNLKLEEEPLDSLKPVLDTADDQRTALEDLFNLQ